MELTLSSFIETALDYDWELTSVKEVEKKIRMTLTTHYGEIVMQFSCANFSGDTEVAILRKGKLIITDKAKNLDFCVGSIAIKFDDEEY